MSPRSGARSACPFSGSFLGPIAVVFAALGAVIGSMLRHMQGFQLITSFLVMSIARIQVQWGAVSAGLH